MHFAFEGILQSLQSSVREGVFLEGFFEISKKEYFLSKELIPVHENIFLLKNEFRD